jgi:uncharacterized Zn-binding protein involved in type VI secretion
MAAASRKGDLTAGHGCFPPTAITSSCSRTYINGILASVFDCSVATHRCGKSVHVGRKVSSGSGTVIIENKAATRIGDSVNCGDSVGQGSPNVQFGG